jgi:co-chaperonin GroES (HSP10)
MAKRKDMLAAGARSATFMGGIGDNDPLRNAAKGKDAKRNTFVPEAAKPEARKRFIPTKGNLLIRRDEVLSTSVIVTDTMEKEKPAEGTILSTSADSDFILNQHVVFGKYAGAEFKLNGETLLLMGEDDIKGTLVDETETETLKNLAGICIPGIPRA